MLSKVLNKNCVSINCAAKESAPQKGYMQVLGRTSSAASLMPRGLCFVGATSVSVCSLELVARKRKNL